MRYRVLRIKTASIHATLLLGVFIVTARACAWPRAHQLALAMVILHDTHTTRHSPASLTELHLLRIK